VISDSGASPACTCGTAGQAGRATSRKVTLNIHRHSVDPLLRRPALAALLAAAGLLAGCGGEDSDAARIERLRGRGDAAGLAREVERPEAQVSCQAVRALGRIGAPALPQVEMALKDSRREVRAEAALAYARAAGGTAAPPLATLARSDPVPDVRATAVTALGHMRALDEMEALLAAVEDPELVVRERAAEAVARIMGRRYDFSGSPEECRRTIAEVRDRWGRENQVLREYYARQRAYAPRSKGKENIKY